MGSRVADLEGGGRPAKRVALLRGDRLRRVIDTQRLRDARAIGGIGLGAVGDMTLFDLDARVTHSAGSVLEQQSGLIFLTLSGLSPLREVRWAKPEHLDHLFDS